ncbi:hypothetical protein BKA69DRAFT_1170587 [Paraphysoderma sedebokerense]|nr:hypothetical protein BKA69DRAFT_1170587 [Paraphysoderma sedebokerense]
MSATECALLASIHDKLKPPSVLQNWTNAIPAGSLMALAVEGLAGSIPPEIASLTGLQFLNMFSNSLTGTIPVEISSLVNLQDFAFGINNITGVIPIELTKLKSLAVFDVDKNRISGSIPPEIGNCISLKSFNLGNNALSGTLPPGMRSLSSLEFFKIGVNQISGSIPPEFEYCKSLKTLLMWGNRLTGEIPPQLFNLVNLESLAMEYNSFSGAIPTNIKNLKSLKFLDLHMNSITSLPPQITELPLEKCSLEKNPFSCIPALPPACSQSMTASKCPAPTGDGSDWAGTIGTNGVITILVSVLVPILVVVIGLFWFRRRRLMKKIIDNQSVVAKNENIDQGAPTSIPSTLGSGGTSVYNQLQPASQSQSTLVSNHPSELHHQKELPSPEEIPVLTLASEPVLQSPQMNAISLYKEEDVYILSQGIQNNEGKTSLNDS